jgi:translocation and assembly module TamA
MASRTILANLRRTVLVMLALVGVSMQALGQQVSVQVQGNYPQLQDNAEAFIGNVEGRSARNLRRYASIVVSQVSEALRALGYYNPKISWTLEPGNANAGADNQPRLLLMVVPGEPVRVTTRQVDISGPGAEDPKLSGNLPAKPALGDALNHGDYDALRNTLPIRARRRGYFDGKLTTRTLTVNPQTLEADIALAYDSGERFRLGEVTFAEGHWFELDLLDEFVSFQPGASYHADEIAKLSGDLSASGYFVAVNIDAVPERAEDGVIPVQVELTRRQRRSLSAGVGVSTDVGPRLRGNWREHWVNPQGHSLSADTELAQLRQSVSAGYDVPLDPPMTDRLRLGGGLQREDTEDVESELATLGMQWQHRFETDWLQILSLRWESERYTIGNDDESDTSSLLLPGAGYSRLVQDSALDPSQGYNLSFGLSGAHRALLSTADVLHIKVSAKGLTTLARKHRFLARVQIGGLGTNSFTDVPPSLRFFAGGDQSVRGYGYETLAPLKDSGATEGGRYLLAGSVEYQYEFASNGRAALFVDHGNAVNDLLDPLATGVGVGVRWISPVGPLRLDLAKGLNPEFGGDWRLHFSMGPEL